MPDTINVVHFHNGTGGGVLSVIRNLLLYKQHANIQNHVIYTINKEKQKQYALPGLKGAATEQVFYYSPNWNFYYTSKQLAKLVPDEQCLLVAHDWLELGMISNLGLQNPVVQFLHGHYDYYFNLAVKHEKNIDAFICIAEAIYEKLILLLPHRKNDIFYKRFPVHEIKSSQENNKFQRIGFIGRCEELKGYQLLPKIADELDKLNQRVEWHIIGTGSLEIANQNLWAPQYTLRFYGELNNDEVLTLLPSFDYLLLPSLAEGMPVTVIEAMKAGVIPIVNDLPGGMEEIVINGETGYRIPNNVPADYAKKITFLNENISTRKQILSKAKQLADEWFNPQINTSEIEKLFIKFSNKKKNLKTKKKIYGSRLDQPWLPNSFVMIIRSFKLKKLFKQ